MKIPRSLFYLMLLFAYLAPGFWLGAQCWHPVAGLMFALLWGPYLTVYFILDPVATFKMFYPLILYAIALSIVCIAVLKKKIVELE